MTASPKRQDDYASVSSMFSSNAQDISLEELYALTNPDPKEGFGYVRVSSLTEKRKQQGEITVETQEDSIKAYAKREKIKIVGWIYDLNISGRRDMFLKRQIMPTIERIKAGEADCVIVYNVSRWGRSSVENQLSEAALWEVGGRLLSATEPNDEKSTVGKFTRQQLYMMAEYQSNMIGDSWKAAHQNRLKKGLPRDGRARLGYSYTRRGVGDAEFTTDPQTGPLLAEAYRAVINGETLWSIVRKLRDLGVTLPSDPTKPITYMVLRGALDSGFGAGKLVLNTKGPFKDRRFITGTHEPLIDADEWDQYLKLRLAEEGNKRMGRPPLPKLALQGLVRCGCCQRPMKVDRRASGDRYMCTNKKNEITSTRPQCEIPTGIRASIVDRAVQQWLRSFTMDTAKLSQVVADRAVAARGATADVKALETQLSGLQTTRRNYIRMRGAEIIASDEELRDMLKPVDAEIKIVEDAILKATRVLKVHKIPEMDMFEAILGGWLSGMSGAALNKGLSQAIQGIYIGTGHSASSPSKIDILGTWETREPEVTVRKVRGIDDGPGRHCTRCLKYKNADQFYRRKRGKEVGKLSSWCRECHKGYYRLEWTPGRGTKASLVQRRDRRKVYENGHKRGDQVRDKFGIVWTRGAKYWHASNRPKTTKNGKTWDQLVAQHGPVKAIGHEDRVKS